jgi:two-component system response regulator DesR
MLEALGEGIGRPAYAARLADANRSYVIIYVRMTKARPLILLLEDDRASAEALQLVLRDWGADVVHGADADDVVSAAGSRAAKAAMIITDFHLPSANGVSAAQQLRKRAPRAQVLVLSGSLNSDAKRAARGAGYAFLPKPAPPREIIAWLERQRELVD